MPYTGIVPRCSVTFWTHPEIIPVGQFFRRWIKSINQSSVYFHCKLSIDWLIDDKSTLTWLVYWIRTARSVLRGRTKVAEHRGKMQCNIHRLAHQQQHDDVRYQERTCKRIVNTEIYPHYIQQHHVLIKIKIWRNETWKFELSRINCSFWRNPVSFGESFGRLPPPFT